MTHGELREAIEGPARQAGLRLEPGLVELLVRDVENEPGALPLLSHALAETWARREAGVLTVDGYRATGDIQGAVAQSAEAMWESLPRRAGRGPGVAAAVGRPVPGGRTRRSPRVTGRGHRRPGPDRALDLLIRCRLVTTDDKTVTLAHEALARAWPRLRSWLDEDGAGHLLLRHLTVAAEDWQTRGRPDSELYRGARLTPPLDWRTTDDTVADHRRDRLPGRLRSTRRGRAARGPCSGPAAARRPGQHRPRPGRGPDRRARRRPTEPTVRNAPRAPHWSTSLSPRASPCVSTRRDLAALLAVQAYRLRPSAATRSALLGVFTPRPDSSDTPRPAAQQGPGPAASGDVPVRRTDPGRGRGRRCRPADQPANGADPGTLPPPRAGTAERTDGPE